MDCLNALSLVMASSLLMVMTSCLHDDGLRLFLCFTNKWLARTFSCERRVASSWRYSSKRQHRLPCSPRLLPWQLQWAPPTGSCESQC